MKKSLLLVAVALLSFPTLTQTALMETELSFKVRNARGQYPFGTYHEGMGRVNLANGNLNVKRTLVARPGRAGMDLDLSIYYNSKIWDRSGSKMRVKDTGSKVGLGWYLGFPRLVQGASTYAIVFPDGSSHEIQQHDDGVWKSVDSTYILYNPSTYTATLKGGTRLIFEYSLGNTRYMTVMKDANGNMIRAYYNGNATLSSVSDTTGTAAKFYYDGEGYLNNIISLGRTTALIRFSYQPADITGSSYPFSIPKEVPSGEKELASITIELPDRHLIERFGYFYGLVELGRIEKGVKLISSGEEQYSTLVEYNYGTKSFSDPTYTSVEERVVTNITEYSGASAYNTALTYTIDGNRSNPTRTKLTDIRGVTNHYFFSSVYPARSWTDGLISSVERKNSAQTVTYRMQATEWEQDLANVSFIVNPRPFRVTTTLDDGQFFKNELLYMSDGTDNVRQVTEYKFANAGILRSTVTGYLHETNPAYKDKNLTNLPVSVSLRDGSGIEVARTEYGYDEYPMTVITSIPAGMGEVFDLVHYNNQNITVRGNRTSVRRKYLEQDRYLTTTFTHDVTGNVVSSTDPRGYSSTYAYFLYYSWLSRIKNALNQTVASYGYGVQVLWNENTGAYELSSNGTVSGIGDMNNVSSYYYYDELSRLTQEISWAGQKDYSYDDFNFLTTEMSTYETLYGLQNSTGSLIRTEQYVPEENNIVATSGYNNPWGQPSAVSFPYRDGSTGVNTTYTYDPMGRVMTRIVPDVGTTSYQYIGNTVTVTNPESKKRKYTYNELGRVIRVDEQDAAGNLTIPTTYLYDAVGNLLEISQIGQGGMPTQTRAFTYDSLGRVTSETHPEKGTTSYTYDDNGNVISTTDARGVAAVSTYDTINRRTSISYSDGTPSATFVYDEATSGLLGVITYGKGRMTSAWTSDGIGYSWSFDYQGRVTQQMASIDGAEYSLGYSYYNGGCGCSEGELHQITYPDGTTVNYDRDLLERITKIYISPSSPYAQYSYNSQSGAVSNVMYGDSIEDYYVYDNMGRLKEKHLRKPGGIHTEWLYSFNASSQVSRIDERIFEASYTDRRKFTYSYDKVQRLTSASHALWNGSSWNPADQINSFSYDQFGNMLANQLQFPGNPGLNEQVIFDVNPTNNRLAGYTDSEGTKTTTYDASGNLLTEGTWSYAYDGAGRLATVGANDGIYRYDALGRRVKKTYTYPSQSGTVSGNIISIYGSGGELLADYKTETGPSGPNNSRTEYIVNGGTAVARRIIPESGGVIREYLHRNHLNQVVDAAAYGAGYGSASWYGQPYASGGNDQFAGHKEDPESGLHYNLARSYNSIMSRWLTADSVTASIYDPQSLNKYGYVRNDPINWIDSDGRDGVRICGGLAGSPSSCADTNFEPPPNSFAVNPFARPEGYGPIGGGGVGGRPFPRYRDAEVPVPPKGNRGSGFVGPRLRGFVSVSNPSKTGPQQERISAVLNWISVNIDDDCAKWLNGVGDAITSLLGDATDERTVLIGHGTFSDPAVAAFVGNHPSQTDIPDGFAITINDTGLFFNAISGMTAGGYRGGSSQAQVFILLHELGHWLDAPGFQADFQNGTATRSNDYLVKKYCIRTIYAAQNIR